MSKLHLYALLSVMGTTLMASPEKVQGQRVEAYLSEDSVYVGDRFTLTLIAMHEFEGVPSFPVLDSAFGDIVPTELVSAGSRYIDTNVRLDSAVYEVTTFALDTARLAPIAIGFEDSSVTAFTAEQVLLVKSMVPQEATGIRDMAPPIEFVGPLWPYVLLGLAVLIAALLIWYMIRQRNQPAPSVLHDPGDSDTPPAVVALERLHALENTALAERSQVEAFYVELSDALRTYIEQRLRIPALESTTQELIQNLTRPATQYQIPSGVPGQLDQILSLADLVKFADVTPSIPEGRTALHEAIQVVRRVETKFDQLTASEELATAG